jgi:cation diffusion facilitator family transporter
MNRDNLERYNKAKKGVLVSIIGNLFLAALKIIVGLLGRSFALITDGIHSLSDIGSSGVVLLGLTIAAKPKDKIHPYGHGKAESLAANSISVLLIIVAFLIAGKAIVSLMAGEALPQPALITLWVALISVIIKEVLYRYKIFLGRKLKSTSLVADAWHHRSDALSSIVVVLSIGCSALGPEGWRYLDRLAAVFVAGVIVFMAIKIYLKSTSELMDESVDKDVINLVKEKAKQVQGVKKIETLLVRKSGLDFLVDIHIEVSPELDVTSSHQIAKEVKNKVLDEIPQVKSILVHIEPHV